MIRCPNNQCICLQKRWVTESHIHEQEDSSISFRSFLPTVYALKHVLIEAPPTHFKQKQSGTTKHPVPEPRGDLGKGGGKDIPTPQLRDVGRLQRMNTERNINTLQKAQAVERLLKFSVTNTV